MASRTHSDATRVQIPTRAEVETMVVSEACLRETLRRYTPVPVVTRIANQDTQIGEYAIPAGTKVTLHLQGTHEQWADPHEYRPARFLPGGEFEAFPPDVRRYAQVGSSLYRRT